MLHYNTISDLLREYLLVLMNSREFEKFRLVGGTALSLQLGHRESIDIDLFTDSPYGSIDFSELDSFLQSTFPYTEHSADLIPAMGKSYFIGAEEGHSIKLDVFYTDSFIQPALVEDNIRIATAEEIAAMKIDVVQRGGRKKDFWDLHELLSVLSIERMLGLHQQRYQYNHDEHLILNNFSDFSLADEDFDPKCLRGNYWEFIKEDIEDALAAYWLRK